ncbi:MAG TPA: SRPBCC family protein [Phototrophicaceae bacterium]|nr:SRPBCC family protein [Phototrophicaceae bacterium]
MTTIDHRILIPAAPDLVWNYISDISHNPDWQIDCQEVVFLTSRREGPGLRWRYSAPGGDRVVAVTAWYNGLGYEYYFVDGVPFRENKGRLRLQEIPEGTIVQWTFHYELGGLFGGVRNTLSLNRQTDHTIAESLRTLWQQMKQTGATAQTHEAKSLMRDAPDVNARSAYQPRHPSAAQQAEGQKPEPAAEPPISADDAQPIRIIAEPPLDEEDTRQRRAVPVSQPPAEPAEVPPDIEGEPEFLNEIGEDYSRFEPPRDPSDTQPRKAVELPVDQPTQPTPAEPPKPAAPTALFERPSQQETEPLVLEPPPTETTPLVRPPELVEYLRDRSEPKPTVQPEPPAEAKAEPEPSKASIYDAPPTPPVIEKQPEAPTPPTPIKSVEPSAPATASAAPSIWEVFGIPRPSETQEAASVSAQATEPVSPTPEVSPTEPTIPVSVEPPKADITPEPQAEPQIEVVAVPAIVEAAPLLGDSTAIKFPPASSHVGLRIVMRRRLVRVRRS